MDPSSGPAISGEPLIIAGGGGGNGDVYYGTISPIQGSRWAMETRGTNPASGGNGTRGTNGNGGRLLTTMTAVLVLVADSQLLVLVVPLVQAVVLQQLLEERAVKQTADLYQATLAVMAVEAVSPSTEMMLRVLAEAAVTQVAARLVAVTQVAVEVDPSLPMADLTMEHLTDHGLLLEANHILHTQAV